MALGRTDEFLYGFDKSQIDKDVLDEIEAAGTEARIDAYTR